MGCFNNNCDNGFLHSIGMDRVTMLSIDYRFVKLVESEG